VVSGLSHASLCRLACGGPRLCAGPVLLSGRTPPTEIYTLSLHDALPISPSASDTDSPPRIASMAASSGLRCKPLEAAIEAIRGRSEEHTAELQSREKLVCRLLLEKKKKQRHPTEQTRRDELSGRNSGSS